MEQVQSPFEEFRTHTQSAEYAGFWLRVVAYIIDAIVMWIPAFIISFIFGVSNMSFDPQNQQPSDIFTGAYFGSMFLNMVIYWLYFALMESSAKQATLGKMALKLKVTDMQGNRIGFGQATGRFFGKIVSGMILMIGFIMAGFTEKKQALHDIMASTLVVKSNPDAVVSAPENETY
jgi:uncharacterized RDD family membrane protein YckC